MFGGRKRRRAIWTEVASELGGTHQLPTKWWRGDENITATVHGVPVKLDVYVVSSGKSSQTYTRVAAAYAHGPGPKMKVSKQGFFSKLGKAIGMQDIPTGDAVFDATFVLKSDNIPIARRLWSDDPRAQALLLADTWITSKPEKLELTGYGRWDDPEKMRSAIELVGVLAATDIYGKVTLEQLGSVTQPDGERPRAELDTGARVVVMAEDRDDILVMSARVYDPTEHEPMTFDVVDGRAELATKLPQAAQVHLARVGTGTLSIGNTSAFLWSSLELDPERLRAGADLLGAISLRGGVYR
ncbi:MAG: hypothetical protein M4D80_32835 [Myxococcota bacterium]|nr:hypothetical protein [Myxococcota bacterium]